jgi:predicted nucleic acid-binding protein
VLRAFATLTAGRIAPVLDTDVAQAAALADDHPRLSARDLLHVAVMQRLGATHIASADRDFDAVPGIQRLDPAQLAVWRGQLGL